MPHSTSQSDTHSNLYYIMSLVIFDLDGTLLNTISDLGEAANYALRASGYPEHTLSSYPLYVGNGITKLIERVLPEESRDPENVMRIRKLFMQYYDEHLWTHTQPYPGIPEMLKALHDQGTHIAVASNKYQEATGRLIEHFFGDMQWSAVEGQKEGYPLKPDPSVVFEILGKVPTPKSEVLYVGDSGVDMETARRACVASCGVTWGFRPAKELREYYAQFIVNRPSEILELVP